MEERVGQVIPLVLLGPGRVGRELLSLVSSRREYLAESLGLRLQLMAVADRGSLLVSRGGGLSDEALAELVTIKSEGGAICNWPDGLHSAETQTAIEGSEIESGSQPPILVDTTASDTTASLLDARARGWRLVLANKVPLTGSLGDFERITCGGVGARWETTVAGSLPVVRALQALIDCGDEIRWITGALSGTMGAVVAAMQSGASFSAAVREAIDRGVAEPDPRSDLSGRDTARKALILARMIGYRLDLDQVRLEGLVPPPYLDLDRQQFLDRLPELDTVVGRRPIRTDGTELRYLATIGQGSVRVGLIDLDGRSPIAGAPPTTSVVVFESAAFRRHPIVLTGRTEGPSGTALGVLADIVSLCRESPGSSSKPVVETPTVHGRGHQDRLRS